MALKPFSESEVVKTYVLKVAEIVCRDKRQAFANIILTRNTVADRISDLSTDLDWQLLDFEGFYALLKYRRQEHKYFKTK